MCKMRTLFFLLGRVQSMTHCSNRGSQQRPHYRNFSRAQIRTEPDVLDHVLQKSFWTISIVASASQRQPYRLLQNVASAVLIVIY